MISPGDRVRLTESAKVELRRECSDHLEEFGNCTGLVLGPAEKGWPELDVRWDPSGLRYGYRPDQLDQV